MIQITNLATTVTMEIDKKQVTKSIAAWIHRRRDLAKLETEMWSGLTDKGLREGQSLPSTNPQQPPTPVKIRRYYEPKIRDEKVALYLNEPSLIDRTLEVVNATTDMVEEVKEK